MQCPMCGSKSRKITDSRPRPDGTTKRTCVCKNCGSRYNTTERVSELGDEVSKSDILSVIASMTEEEKYTPDQKKVLNDAIGKIFDGYKVRNNDDTWPYSRKRLEKHRKYGTV